MSEESFDIDNQIRKGNQELNRERYERFNDPSHKGKQDKTQKEVTIK